MILKKVEKGKVFTSLMVPTRISLLHSLDGISDDLNSQRVHRQHRSLQLPLRKNVNVD